MVRRGFVRVERVVASLRFQAQLDDTGDQIGDLLLRPVKTSGRMIEEGEGAERPVLVAHADPKRGASGEIECR